MKRIERELGIVFMADLLLIHINPDSDFLKEHPEADYNTEDSPHLNLAYYIDKKLSASVNRGITVNRLLVGFLVFKDLFFKEFVVKLFILLRCSCPQAQSMLGDCLINRQETQFPRCVRRHAHS